MWIFIWDVLLARSFNCQYLNECTKHTLSQTSLPLESVHINIFQMDNLPWK